jgi:molybdopterin/thiamine biosynthesis adenylyltransferase
MRASRICVIGARGLSAELCKNLVLAGVGALTLVDFEPVSVRHEFCSVCCLRGSYANLGMDVCSDLSAQFFLTEQHVGKNVCLALATAHTPMKTHFLRPFFLQRAQSTIPGLCALNPNVTVTAVASLPAPASGSGAAAASSSDVTALPDSFFAGFDVVIATDQPLASQVQNGIRVPDRRKMNTNLWPPFFFFFSL